MPCKILSTARSSPRRNIIRSVPQHILDWCIEDLQKMQQQLVAILNTNPSPAVADKVLDALKLLKGQVEEIGQRAINRSDLLCFLHSPINTPPRSNYTLSSILSGF